MALPYSLTDTRPAQLGLIVLQADETIERDMRALLPENVELLVSRLPSSTTVSSENLGRIEQELTQAASLFPEGADLSGVGFGCTSGAAEIGPEAVAHRIRQGVATPFVTDPFTSLLAACRHLELSSLAVLSPYVAEVSKGLTDLLTSNGIAVSDIASFDVAEEAKVVRITSASIEDGARHLMRDSDADGLFLSCTNLRTLPSLAPLSAVIGKPVLSSNQVLAWDMLRQSGTGDIGLSA